MGRAVETCWHDNDEDAERFMGRAVETCWHDNDEDVQNDSWAEQWRHAGMIMMRMCRTIHGPSSGDMLA
ncbi:hypothetical protein ACOMHN_053226 [Nucella lapillus]